VTDEDGSQALVAAGYDAVYAGAARSPTLARIWRQAASGDDYPAEFGNISFVTRAELARIADQSGLARGDHLVDLACGAGGPGLWVARQQGARLTGVDLSAAGVEAAGERARAVGLADRATFRVGSFAATGLGSGSADGAMTVDALQYAPGKAAALAEVARILRPGGRFVFTAFEVDPERVAGAPVLGDDPVADYRPGLEAAGFTVESYDETPGWWPTMQAAYRAVLDAADALGQEMGPVAVAALAMEMTSTLELEPYRRRVLAVATRR
jgi:SAM-dependent methyltransferase